MSQKYDIIIVGSGLAGLTQAALLAQEGFDIACVGAMPATTDKRTTAISYGSHLVLKQANIWADLELKACPIKDIQILDGSSPVLLNFDVTEHDNIPAFGWIIENKDLFNALLTRVSDLKNLTFYKNIKITDINRHDTNIETILDNGETLSAQLIIGADGRRSFVREQANIQSKKWDYHQTAIVCFITHENAHNDIAIEHFYSSGPFAVLPVTNMNENHRSSIVWTVERFDLDQIISDETLLKTALQERLPKFYGPIKDVTDIQAYPLNFNHAFTYMADRTVLIADAAHGIHPIAGQGLNIGLQDVRELTTLLTSLKDDKERIADVTILKNYEKKRMPDNMRMAAATDTLNKLFSTDNNLVSLIRKKGLKLVQKTNRAKKFFGKTAMGIKN